jgi:hypothetical protein
MKEAAIGAAAAKANFVRDLILARRIYAAVGMNGSFRRRIAASQTKHLQRFSRCVRMQHKISMAESGSIRDLRCYLLQ